MAKKHQAYEEVDGIKYYSVTTVLGIIRKPFLERWRGDIGNKAADEKSQKSMAFGTMIHDYCETINKGQGHSLILEDIDDIMARGMIAWYKDWFFENVEEVLYTEETLYSKKFQYKGKLDFIAKLKGFTGPSVIDIKTGDYMEKDYFYQLSAYKVAAKEYLNVDVRDRIVIQFKKKTAEYRMIPLDSSTHESDFAGFLLAKELYKNYNEK